MENTYTVLPNDNLYDIASKYNTTVEILKILNNLESNILQIGQILKLPSFNNQILNPNDYIIYTIKKGDNLFNVANNYNISLEELINFNNQGTTLLKIGDELLIPKKSDSLDITYVVKPGDTLFNIAKRFNTTVDKLKEKNNLNSNLLKISDTIIIPGTKNYQTYVVKTNDTLSSIANNFNTPKDILKQINNLETEDIVVGEILLIP